MEKLKKIFLLVCLFLLAGCTRHKAELGTAENPVKIFFIPSVEAKLIFDNAQAVVSHLEKVTPYKYSVSVPASYVAVVESFGTRRADVAFLTTYSYILAHERYGAEARIMSIRYGEAFYRSQILARADGPIKKLEDIHGKKFAFVDPASGSGYLLPAKLFKDRHIKPSQTVFAQKHDNVVTMIYQKQVDAGATYYSPPAEGQIQDARKLVKTQYPDVEQKIKIITMTDPIPNDPIVFRKGMPEDMKNKIVDAMIAYVKTPEGRKAFDALYGMTDLKKCVDADYDRVRSLLQELGKSAHED